MSDPSRDSPGSVYVDAFARWSEEDVAQALDKIQLQKRDGPGVSVLQALQEREGEPTDAVRAVVAELVEDRDGADLHIALTWQYIKRRRLWEHSIDPELRTEAAFSESFCDWKSIRESIRCANSTEQVHQAKQTIITAQWGTGWLERMREQALWTPKRLTKNMMKDLAAISGVYRLEDALPRLRDIVAERIAHFPSYTVRGSNQQLMPSDLQRLRATPQKRPGQSIGGLLPAKRRNSSRVDDASRVSSESSDLQVHAFRSAHLAAPTRDAAARGPGVTLLGPTPTPGLGKRTISARADVSAVVVDENAPGSTIDGCGQSSTSAPPSVEQTPLRRSGRRRGAGKIAPYLPTVTPRRRPPKSVPSPSLKEVLQTWLKFEEQGGIISVTTLQHLRQTLDANERPPKVIVIRHDGDSGELCTIAEHAQLLRDFGGDKMMDIQDPRTGKPGKKAAARIALMMEENKRSSLGYNALNMPDIARVPPPAFTRWPEYRLLEHLIERSKLTEFGKTSFEERSFCDVTGCQHFNLVGFPTSGSGPHLDVLGGTWVRVLRGRKVWMVVDMETLNARARRDFAQSGSSWMPPLGMGQRVVLEAGDVLIMMPGAQVIHAAYSEDLCIMDGGMFWERAAVADILRLLYWLATNQRATNEPLPQQMPAIVAALRQWIGSTQDGFGTGQQRLDAVQWIEKLQRLGCKCGHDSALERTGGAGEGVVEGGRACLKSCTCRKAKRPCTTWCVGHDLSTYHPSGSSCQRDPLAGGESLHEGSEEDEDSGEDRTDSEIERSRVARK